MVARNAIAKSESVGLQSLHGKNDRNPSFILNAASLISVRVLELRLHLVDQILDAYRDHLVHRRRSLHLKIYFWRLLGRLDFCRDDT